MIHFADEVEQFGCLDTCSSFPFENYMQKLKKMMSTDTHEVVEFLDEKSVEVVPRSWIEACDGVLCYYWLRTNFLARVKELELPDKTRWKKHKVRIFTFADNLKSAQKFARRAIATSNIESDDESINEKPRKRPRLKRSIEEFPDYSDIENDDENDEPVIQHRAPRLPPAPRYASFSMNNKHLLESSESNMTTAVNEILSTNSRNLPVYSELISFAEKDLYDGELAPEILNTKDHAITSPSTSRTPSQCSDKRQRLFTRNSYNWHNKRKTFSTKQ
ncbi:uncharacterized protein LOC124451106 [Xenia sp. Carnegie-2017]|uniref:uncharacterized protein LOC124451106 n=1 Tax=Xenia sp. Carnegie-2017 TaxID=2897299 RepID=UPI001F03B441|nr:uncharacterized protein LOC124451106 [Xenia sp. Carnegie-2017]